MQYAFRDHVLDTDRRELRRGTALVPVEPQVFDLLLYLLRNRDRVVTRDDLIGSVWGGRIVSESALTTRINAVRTVIRDSGKEQALIRTLPRKGFRFIGTVEEGVAAGAGMAPVVVRADVRAFAVLMGEDEPATRTTLHDSRALMVAVLEGRAGRVIATPADTVVAIFADAPQAVAATADARDAVIGRNRALPPESRVYYRFGIATGEIVEAGLGGAAIERAAALALRAPAGAVRISEAVAKALPPGLAEKTEIDEYALAGGTPAAAIPLQLQALDPPLPQRPSIVLLPFKALGDDQALSEAFADGLRIEIQNALTKMSGVFLLGVGSAVAMRGWSAVDAAARAGVRYVLEGNVQRARERLRVGVTLTDTVANTVVFAETYDRALDREFALQDEITSCIVTTLDVKLVSGEQARIWHKGLTDPVARERFYRGIQAFFRMNAESLVYARDCFGLVAELAPGSPLGPTWSALCLWFEAARGFAPDPKAAIEQAGRFAERAAAMEDADGQAHTVLGNVRLLQRRFDEALKVASEALVIRPGCTNANGFLANVLLYCGEPQRAASHARRAIRYMPVYPPWFVEILAAAYRDAGCQDLAIVAAREVLRIAPAAAHGRLVLASALVRDGWVDDAQRVIRDARSLDGTLSLTRFAASQPYRDPAVLAAVVDDLRKAGLGE